MIYQLLSSYSWRFISFCLHTAEDLSASDFIQLKIYQLLSSYSWRFISFWLHTAEDLPASDFIQLMIYQPLTLYSRWFISLWLPKADDLSAFDFIQSVICQLLTSNSRWFTQHMTQLSSISDETAITIHGNRPRFHKLIQVQQNYFKKFLKSLGHVALNWSQSETWLKSFGEAESHTTKNPNFDPILTFSHSH